MAESRYLPHLPPYTNGELIWVLLLAIAVALLFCDGQSTAGCGGFARRCCFCPSGTLTLPEAFSILAIRMSILIAWFIIGDGLVRTGVATVVGVPAG